MEKKFINFDTNYINKILDNKLEANGILKELAQDYNFSINIAMLFLHRQPLNACSILERFLSSCFHNPCFRLNNITI